MARKPGKMPPFHDHVRGQRHDLRRTFLHAALDGRGVVVFPTPLGVAPRPRRLLPGAIYAYHATAQRLSRPPTIRGSDDQAALCRLRTEGFTPQAVPSGTTRTDACTQPTPASGRHLHALLSPCALCISGLGGPGEPACQWPSQRRPLAPVSLHRLRGLCA